MKKLTFSKHPVMPVLLTSYYPASLGGVSQSSEEASMQPGADQHVPATAPVLIGKLNWKDLRVYSCCFCCLVSILLSSVSYIKIILQGVALVPGMPQLGLCLRSAHLQFICLAVAIASGMGT